MKKIKKSLSLLLALLMLATTISGVSFSVNAANDSINYIDIDGSEKTADVTVLTSDTISLSGGWYAVKSDIEIGSRIVCSGDVMLILADGATLTAAKGITVNSNSSLTVYDQIGGSGELKVTDADNYYAGIGGAKNQSSGNITVNGGKLTVTGGYYAAGIGGSESGAGTVTINGGRLVVYGGDYGAGIGGGRFGEGDVIVNGGEIWTCGGVYASAIGGGYYASGDVTINGGSVVARRYNSGTGIGAGADNSSAAIDLNLKWLNDSIWSDSFNGTVTLGSPIKNNIGIIPAGIVNTVSIIENKYLYPASPAVGYLDSDGTVKEKADGEYTILSDSVTSLAAGWYVVASDISISNRVDCTGAVNIILCDGCTLTAPAGFHVTESNALTVYGQDRGDGALVINQVASNCAGIGGNNNENSGTVTVYGGAITVSGGTNASAIGGGNNANGTVIVNGGTVIATGDAAGLGAGFTGRGYITISGGTVTAIGGGSSAAIGGSWSYPDNSDPISTVTISGGIVNATGGILAAAIGGGRLENGIVTISGGTVTTTGGETGIGGGYNASGIVTITGGNVRSNGAIGGNPASTISLSWTDTSDSVYAESYQGAVTLNRAFFADSNALFPGAVDNNSAIGGKELTPLDADCKIEWKNYDGTMLETDYLKNGQIAAYNSEVPTKAVGPWGSYTFTGWTDGANNYPADLEVTASGRNITYTATYQTNPRIFVTSGITNGTLIPADTVCAPGTQTSVTAVPDSGYRLKSISAVHRTNLIALSGTEGDSYDENYPNLVDGSAGGRWCVSSRNCPFYIVMKATRPVEMTGYSLTTSQNAPAYDGTCNWKNWKIYGANFTNDSEATRNSDHWQLITEVTNDDTLGPVSTKQYDYYLDSAAPEYQYYKIEVSAGKGSSLLFMYEFALIEDPAELTLEGTGNTRTFTMPDDCVYLSAEFEPVRYFVGNSLSLRGDIGVNYYIDLNSVSKDNAKVVFNWGSGGYAKTEEIPLSDLTPDGNGYYKITARVAAAQMTDLIHAKLYDGETLIAQTDYSVAQYARYILNESDEVLLPLVDNDAVKLGNLRGLCKSMLIYGAKAQAQFNYRTEDPSDADLVYSLDDVGSLGTTSLPADFEEASGLKFSGSSLILRTETTYRLYFTVTDKNKLDNLTVKLGDKTLTYSESGGYIYYDIADIPAAMVLKDCVLSFGNLTVTANAGEYMSKAIDGGNETLVETMKALYWYTMAAKTYYGVSY